MFWGIFFAQNKVNLQTQAYAVDLITVANLYECLYKLFVAERVHLKYFITKKNKICEKISDEEMRMIATDPVTHFSSPYSWIGFEFKKHFSLKKSIEMI